MQHLREHVMSKDDKRQNKDTAKSTHIIIWTTSSSSTHIYIYIYIYRERERERERERGIYIYIYIERERERERERNTEQWNLRNIGPRLYKVVNEVDSLYSGPLPLTYALRAF
jgi:hypothetical protein